MFKLLLDENFNGKVERALGILHPQLDIVRVQDTTYAAIDDFALIGIAHDEKRLLLSHDFSTMPDAYEARILQGLPVCGILMIHDRLPVGRVIEQLNLILGASDFAEWDGLLRYLPTA